MDVFFRYVCAFVATIEATVLPYFYAHTSPDLAEAYVDIHEYVTVSSTARLGIEKYSEKDFSVRLAPHVVKLSRWIFPTAPWTIEVPILTDHELSVFFSPHFGKMVYRSYFYLKYPTAFHNGAIAFMAVVACTLILALLFYLLVRLIIWLGKRCKRCISSRVARKKLNEGGLSWLLSAIKPDDVPSFSMVLSANDPQLLANIFKESFIHKFGTPEQGDVPAGVVFITGKEAFLRFAAGHAASSSAPESEEDYWSDETRATPAASPRVNATPMPSVEQAHGNTGVRMPALVEPQTGSTLEQGSESLLPRSSSVAPTAPETLPISSGSSGPSPSIDAQPLHRNLVNATGTVKYTLSETSTGLSSRRSTVEESTVHGDHETLRTTPFALVQNEKFNLTGPASDGETVANARVIVAQVLTQDLAPALSEQAAAAHDVPLEVPSSASSSHVSNLASVAPKAAACDPGNISPPIPAASDLRATSPNDSQGVEPRLETPAAAILLATKTEASQTAVLGSGLNPASVAQKAAVCESENVLSLTASHSMAMPASDFAHVPLAISETSNTAPSSVQAELSRDLSTAHELTPPLPSAAACDLEQESQPLSISPSAIPPSNAPRDCDIPAQTTAHSVTNPGPTQTSQDGASPLERPIITSPSNVSPGTISRTSLSTEASGTFSPTGEASSANTDPSTPSSGLIAGRPSDTPSSMDAVTSSVPGKELTASSGEESAMKQRLAGPPFSDGAQITNDTTDGNDGDDDSDIFIYPQDKTGSFVTLDDDDDLPEDYQFVYPGAEPFLADLAVENGLSAHTNVDARRNGDDEADTLVYNGVGSQPSSSNDGLPGTSGPSEPIDFGTGPAAIVEDTISSALPYLSWEQAEEPGLPEHHALISTASSGSSPRVSFTPSPEVQTSLFRPLKTPADVDDAMRIIDEMRPKALAMENWRTPVENGTFGLVDLDECLRWPPSSSSPVEWLDFLTKAGGLLPRSRRSLEILESDPQAVGDFQKDVPSVWMANIWKIRFKFFREEHPEAEKMLIKNRVDKTSSLGISAIIYPPLSVEMRKGDHLEWIKYRGPILSKQDRRLGFFPEKDKLAEDKGYDWKPEERRRAFILDPLLGQKRRQAIEEMYQSERSSVLDRAFLRGLLEQEEYREVRSEFSFLRQS